MLGLNVIQAFRPLVTAIYCRAGEDLQEPMFAVGIIPNKDSSTGMFLFQNFQRKAHFELEF